MNKTGKYASEGSTFSHKPIQPTTMSTGNTKTGDWSSKTHSASERNPQGPRRPNGGRIK
jgi:hypothetical protein